MSTLGVYPVVATLWWLVRGASLGVYSVCLLWVSTLWCVLCGASSSNTDSYTDAYRESYTDHYTVSHSDSHEDSCQIPI